MSHERELAKSIHAGFINRKSDSLEQFRPRLLVNNHSAGTKVLTSLIKELEQCEEFFFSVAFITYSGVIVLLNTLKELEAKGIKGKILASQYLDFTDPKALKKLLEFENISLKISTGESLHTKGYIFRNDKSYNVIVGSSNLTQSALTKNNEWNMRVSSMEEGSIVHETLNEFNRIFDGATVVTNEWIEAYRLIYFQHKERELAQKYTRPHVIDIVEYTDNDLYKLPEISPNKMQVKALIGIELIRNKNEKKALLVSATGTGKTYLAAFDVKNVNPKKMLFLAHREQILNQSLDSFQKIIGTHRTMGILSGHSKDCSADFLFSTVQMMSKDHMLESFRKDAFNYIVVDESHRAGANSYQKILDYFDADFLLGMTATPERTDEHNICEDFDYNIAYEIRLEQALEEDMLCPFHYFGITELSVEGQSIDDKTEFKYLVSEERINHIVEQVTFYGYDGFFCKGLVFCSRNEEARILADEFTKRGYKSMALTGENTQDEREHAVKRLENGSSADHLDYIFTVDIFNEGVDIPQVNQVVMLRPTKSAIVFVQQLGRGLRKYKSKEFVTVLDFIGNYNNNFMIPIALSDDRSYNKDNIRRFVAEGSRVLPGCSTINFDAIAKKKIYQAIDTVNFNSVTFIKDSYKNLKYRLGRIPTYMDFEKHDSMDMARVFESKSLGSYHNFLVKYEDEYQVDFNDQQVKYIEFISRKLAIGKRPHELIVINGIIQGEKKLMAYMRQQLMDSYHIDCETKTITNVLNVLSNEFQTSLAKKTFLDACIFDYREEKHYINKDFRACLNDNEFRCHLLELVEFGLFRYTKYYGDNYKGTSLQLYQKYSYEDVCRLLEWEKNVVSLNIGGYKYDKPTKTFPVFINYHKEEGISETIKYEDRFLSNTQMTAISKSKRTIESNDVHTFINSEELGVSIELFVRKNKDDKGSKEFYYLGRTRIVGEPVPFKMDGGKVDAVELTHQLETPVREDIYAYITEN